MYGVKFTIPTPLCALVFVRIFSRVIIHNVFAEKFVNSDYYPNQEENENTADCLKMFWSGRGA